MAKAGRPKTIFNERNWAIIDRYKECENFSQVAREFNLSSERVRMLVRAMKARVMRIMIRHHRWMFDDIWRGGDYRIW